jgi:hypothetical protein
MIEIEILLTFVYFLECTAVQCKNALSIYFHHTCLRPPLYIATGYQESLFVGWKVYSSSTNKAKIYSYSIFVQQMYWLQDTIYYSYPSKSYHRYDLWTPPFFFLYISSLLCDVFIINSIEQVQTSPKTQSEIDISPFLKTHKPSILYSNIIEQRIEGFSPEDILIYFMFCLIEKFSNRKWKIINFMEKYWSLL